MSTFATARKTNAATTSAPTASTKPVVSSTAMPRPYKDFLTPALHRRFTKATGAVLILCWLEAIFLSNGSWFWSWFPLSTTGVRALILTIPCLSVFILRVANMHIGHAASTSLYETLSQKLTGRAWATSGVTLLWYSFSAWLFGEVYIWSKSQTANLGWVDYGRSYERPRLNENPIYLRSLLGVLALVQTAVHLLWDVDRILILHDSSATTDSGTVEIDSLRAVTEKLQAQKKHILQFPFNISLVAILANFFVYLLGTRGVTWNLYHWFGSFFVSQIPPNTGPIGLSGVPRLLWQSLSACYLLALLWAASNAHFTAYIEMIPVKKGSPLTNEIKDGRGVVISRSTDPNGSLLRGLEARNNVARGFSFWELELICKQYPDRRRTIFNEVDRKDRPAHMSSTWAAISNACLAEIEAIGRRIRSAQQPVPTRQEVAQQEQQRRQQAAAAEAQKPLGLPRIADQQVKSDSAVTQKSLGSSFSAVTADVAKKLGQHPGSATAVTTWAGKAVQTRADEALPREWREKFAPNTITNNVNNYLRQFIQSSAGAPFRQRFSRRVRAVIFGVPYSAEANIIHAGRSLTKLLVESLKEDIYGQVAKDVPRIIRTFTTTISDTQQFVLKLEPHWTDVNFDGNRSVKEVTFVLAELKSSLEQILLTFSEYANTIGLSQKELREAKEAVGKAQEMVKR